MAGERLHHGRRGAAQSYLQFAQAPGTADRRGLADSACGRLLQAQRCGRLRRDQRAQALHQFRVCQSILSAGFDAAPEPATIALFEQIRLDPADVGSAPAKHR